MHSHLGGAAAWSPATQCEDSAGGRGPGRTTDRASAGAPHIAPKGFYCLFSCSSLYLLIFSLEICFQNFVFNTLFQFFFFQNLLLSFLFSKIYFQSCSEYLVCKIYLIQKFWTYKFFFA